MDEGKRFRRVAGEAPLWSGHKRCPAFQNRANGWSTDTAKSDTNGPPEPGPRCLSGKGDALVTDGPGLSSFLEVTKEPGTFV